MRMTILAALLAGTNLAHGAVEEPPPTPDEVPAMEVLEGLYFEGTNPVLSPTETKALGQVSRWRASSGPVVMPGTDGTIRFALDSQPSIVCAVLQVCDIELEQGEVVSAVHIGDKLRWSVEIALAGVTPHVLIKASEVGLDTSAVILTNRRSYHIQLRSHRTEYMPKVSFVYRDPTEDSIAAVQQQLMVAAEAARQQSQAREAVHRERETIPETREYLGDLSFDYKISGKARWKPVRVYNDSRKTVIEMPEEMAHSEAPSLLVIDGGGEAIVNYRMAGTRFIVDSVFDEAVLVTGVGRKQQRVKITRRLEG